MKTKLNILSIFGALTAMVLAFIVGDAHASGLVFATGLVSFAGGMLHNDQIEKLASNFSAFEENFEDSPMPLPKGVFTFTVSSSASVKRDFYIWSGYQLDALGLSTGFGDGAQTSRYGQMVDGTFYPIGVSSGTRELTGSGSPFGINEFLAFSMNRRGNKVTRIVVRSASPLVHSSVISILKKDPLNALGDRSINLSVHRNPMQQDQNTTIINDTFNLGVQDFVKFSVPAGVTDLTVEMYMNGYTTY